MQSGRGKKETQQLDIEALLEATGVPSDPSQATPLPATPENAAQTPSEAAVGLSVSPEEAGEDEAIDLVLPDDGLSPGLKVEIGETFHLDEHGNMVPGDKREPSAPELINASTTINEAREKLFAGQRQEPPKSPPLPRLPTLDAISGNKPSRRYATRVDVIEAYQFDNKLSQAPGWVDRNWLAYHDGIVVDVPQSPGMPPVRCRIGDWIVYQERQNEDGSPMMRELVVYPDDAFRLLFREITAAT